MVIEIQYNLFLIFYTDSPWVLCFLFWRGHSSKGRVKQNYSFPPALSPLFGWLLYRCCRHLFISFKLNILLLPILYCWVFFIVIFDWKSCNIFQAGSFLMLFVNWKGRKKAAFRLHQERAESFALFLDVFVSLVAATWIRPLISRTAGGFLCDSACKFPASWFVVLNPFLFGCRMSGDSREGRWCGQGLCDECSGPVSAAPAPLLGADIRLWASSATPVSANVSSSLWKQSAE